MCGIVFLFRRYQKLTKGSPVTPGVIIGDIQVGRPNDSGTVSVQLALIMYKDIFDPSYSIGSHNFHLPSKLSVTFSISGTAISEGQRSSSLTLTTLIGFRDRW